MIKGNPNILYGVPYGGFWDMEYATKINGKQYICRENNWDIWKRQNKMSSGENS